MQLNVSKTKEMILGPLAKSNPPLLTTEAGIIHRVTSFKLLGVHIDSTLTCKNERYAHDSQPTEAVQGHERH